MVWDVWWMPLISVTPIPGLGRPYLTKSVLYPSRLVTGQSSWMSRQAFLACVRQSNREPPRDRRDVRDQGRGIYSESDPALSAL